MANTRSRAGRFVGVLGLLWATLFFAYGCDLAQPEWIRAAQKGLYWRPCFYGYRSQDDLHGGKAYSKGPWHVSAVVASPTGSTAPLSLEIQESDIDRFSGAACPKKALRITPLRMAYRLVSIKVETPDGISNSITEPSRIFVTQGEFQNAAGEPVTVIDTSFTFMLDQAIEFKPLSLINDPENSPAES